MASLNKVFLIGNLTKDPEVRYTPKGTAVGDLRLAVSRQFKEKTEVCYIDVVVWDRQAETCGQYLKKGSPVLIEGRLSYEEWEKDGKKSSKHRVTAERVQFMGAGKGGPRDDAQQPEAAGAAPADEPGPSEPPAAGGDDDNLPF